MAQPIDMQQLERTPWPLPIFNAISRATIYRPRVGNRSRIFTTMAAAIEYEDGFTAYPREIPGMSAQSPAAYGWLDADRDQQFKDEARADLAASAE